MNSTTLYQFDVDDVSVGDAFVVLSQGTRRLLLKNLLSQEIELLKFLSKNRRFQREQISEKMFVSLHDYGLILSAPRRLTLSQRANALFKIPSSLVSRLSHPLRSLFSIWGLALILICQILIYTSPKVHFAKIQDFSHWITHVTLIDALMTMGVIFVSMVIHEFGHATACLRVTGATGAIRFLNYRGTLAMAADVSSICLTDERGKVTVAIAGAVFQSTFGACLLATDQELVRMGATMAILSAAFSLTPLPNTDGYWVIRDFFNLSLRPRLWTNHPETHWTDVIYGYGLLAATTGFSILLFKQCLYLFNLIAENYRTISIENIMIFSLFSYLLAVSCIFIWKNFKLFIQEEEK